MPDRQSELLIYADDVWRVVFRLVSNVDDANECYQQTFVDALRVNPGDVRDWRHVLLRIATRRAMDVLRQRYRERSRQDEPFGEPAQYAPPEADLQYEELRQSVRQVLAKLPPLQAEAFVLRHLEQMEPTEIAAQMEIDPNHVRVLVHRALEQVRKSLSQSFQPENVAPLSRGNNHGR